MTCPKCSCNAWKPGDGYFTCFNCGAYHSVDAGPVRPAIVPKRAYGNLKQATKTAEILAGLKEHFQHIALLRTEGKIWKEIKAQLGLPGCISSISEYYLKMQRGQMS